MKFPIRHVSALLLAGLLAAGCDGPTDQRDPDPTTSSKGGWSPTPTADEESEIKREETERKAREVAEKKALSAFEKEVKAEPSLDDKLSLIVTKFCDDVREYVEYTEGTGSDDEPLVIDLSGLFDKYWKAGGRWNSPLGEAALQRGGCPSYPKDLEDTRG